MDDHAWQYIVLHKSLKNVPGALACQAAHAAAESIFDDTWDGKDRSTCSVIALVAEKSEDLERLSVQLEEAGVRHALIREPDEPYRGAATAVGVEPTMDRAKVRAICSWFKLFR